MLKLIKILYIKWIRHQCHHMCAFCDFREECHENME